MGQPAGAMPNNTHRPHAGTLDQGAQTWDLPIPKTKYATQPSAAAYGDMGRYGTTSLAGNSVSAHTTPNLHKGEAHPGQGPPSEVHTRILAEAGSAA